MAELPFPPCPACANGVARCSLFRQVQPLSARAPSCGTETCISHDGAVCELSKPYDGIVAELIRLYKLGGAPREATAHTVRLPRS